MGSKIKLAQQIIGRERYILYIQLVIKFLLVFILVIVVQVVVFWIMYAAKTKIGKDVAVVIAKMVWNTRFSCEWPPIETDNKKNKKKKKNEKRKLSFGRGKK